MTRFQIAKLKQRNQEIWDMYQQGIPVIKIANVYGLKSRQAIYNIFRRDNRPYLSEEDNQELSTNIS